jgi:hypothetical protein
MLILVSCYSYDCQKEGWDGTYDDCYDNFDFQYFPFYGEYEALQTYYSGASNYGSGFATIRFDPDGSFALSLTIDCDIDSELAICVNADPDTPWLLQLDGTFTFSNTLTEYIGTGKTCPYRYRQHSGPYELTIVNSNQVEFENEIIESHFSVGCPQETLVFNYYFPNGDHLQAVFYDHF